jgi:outer membrane lipoprotein SlyB
MQTNRVLATVAVAMAAVAAGCANMTPEQQKLTGQVAGGVTGAAVGSLFGGGTGRVVATGAGAVLGTVVGGKVASQ